MNIWTETRERKLNELLAVTDKRISNSAAHKSALSELGNLKKRLSRVTKPVAQSIQSLDSKTSSSPASSPENSNSASKTQNQRPLTPLTKRIKSQTVSPTFIRNQTRDKVRRALYDLGVLREDLDEAIDHYLENNNNDINATVQQMFYTISLDSDLPPSDYGDNSMDSIANTTLNNLDSDDHSSAIQVLLL